jgi:hypothetical protein
LAQRRLCHPPAVIAAARRSSRLPIVAALNVLPMALVAFIDGYLAPKVDAHELPLWAVKVSNDILDALNATGYWWMVAVWLVAAALACIGGRHKTPASCAA